MKLFQFLAAILSFGALYTKPSLRFGESSRRIDNCPGDTLMLLKNILGDRGISCQSFSEIRRISEKV
jgi:hypothetical protein